MSEKIKVGPQDESKKTSPIAGPLDEEGTVVMNAAANVCHWNDQAFDDGQLIESDGVTYECSFGRWVQLKS